MKKSWIILLLSCVSYSSFFAQQTAVYKNSNHIYQKALQLYQNEEFAASQTFFRKAKLMLSDQDLKANADYYIAQSAVRMQQAGADLLIEDFVNKYPTHPKQNSAYASAGNYYFSIGKYALARKWYEEVDDSRLGSASKNTYYFNKGYALYRAKYYDESKKYFELVSDTEKYGDQSKYYLGYMSYQDNDYDKADTYFEEVKEKKVYNKNLSYYKADRNFKQGKFEKAIELAESQLPVATPNDKSELNKIIGESYFNLKEFEKASPYLEKYKGKRGKWSNTDHYLLGYAYYKQGEYSKSVSEFNKIIGGKDAVAQNAYYHLADAYLKSDQKQQALNAFKNASEMNYEAIIKQDATYNYAKLSYEIGNSFESVPVVLKSYLVKYPDSPKKQEISALLIDSYLSSKNYKEALVVLEEGKTIANKEVYQKVLFYRALELFKNREYKEANTLFDKSISQNQNFEFTQRAYFWKAEAYYKQNDFDLAIVNYKKTHDVINTQKTKELSLLDYQLGYSYFKTRNYEQAIKSFNSFLKTDPEIFYLHDATLRLADSYFVSAKYWPGMETYNKAIEQKNKRADYAHFQKAISYGFVNKNDQKIEDLEAFIASFEKSTYRDDAYFALANTYVAQGKTSKGIANYSKLRNEYPKSSFVSKALLKEGLIYYNKDQSEKAIEKLKYLVANYPNSPEALQAVKTARLVYIDLGKTDEYASWVNSLDFVEITNEELDNTTYEAAEKPYQENDIPRAIAGFEKYLAQFPKGLHMLHSHFYVAQLYSKKGEAAKALPHYKAVAEIEKNEFTETALYRISQTYLEQKSYAEAIPYLKRLEEIADFPQNVIFAQSNLMKSYYEKQQYNETLEFAEKVLSNSRIENEVKIDAQIYKARAALSLKNNDVAKRAYGEVVKTASGKLAAEAVYYLAYFNTENKDYETSNSYVQQLAKDYSSYEEFGAKGLVLMAKNFYGLGDAYQATYVLESIITNFKKFPEVVAESTTLLNEIKAEEAKTNSSIKE